MPSFTVVRAVQFRAYLIRNTPVKLCSNTSRQPTPIMYCTSLSEMPLNRLELQQHFTFYIFHKFPAHLLIL